MATKALSSIGCVFGWGVETTAGVKPTTFKEIEECISVDGVELSPDAIDVTYIKATKKQYIKGYEDTGGTLPTTFNYSDTFLAQWAEMYEAYEAAKAKGLATWFEVYHPSRTNANFYIVEPSNAGAPPYEVGNALQITVNNILVDLPDQDTAVVPSAALSTTE